MLPIAITVAQDGSLEVSFDPEVVTPIGTFSVDVPIAHFSVRVPPAYTLLVILFAAAISDVSAENGGGQAVLTRYDAGNGGDAASAAQVRQWEELIEIKRNVKMRFVYNGRRPGLTSSGNVVTLSLQGGANQIMVQDVSGHQKAPFLVKPMNPLPSPAKGIKVPVAPPKSWPTPSVHCAAADRAGVFTCSAMPTSGYHYQWLVDDKKVGTDSSQLIIPLPGGVHFVSVTLTSGGFSFSALGEKLEVPAIAASASRGPPSVSGALS